MKYCLNYCSLWYSSIGEAYINLRWSDDLIVSSKFKIQISLHINKPSATSTLSCWLRKLNNFYASTYSTTENFEVIFFKFPNCQFTESKACFSYQRHVTWYNTTHVHHRNVLFKFNDTWFNSVLCPLYVVLKNRQQGFENKLFISTIDKKPPLYKNAGISRSKTWQNTRHPIFCDTILLFMTVCGQNEMVWA